MTPTPMSPEVWHHVAARARAHLDAAEANLQAGLDLIATISDEDFAHPAVLAHLFRHADLVAARRAEHAEMRAALDRLDPPKGSPND